MIKDRTIDDFFNSFNVIATEGIPEGTIIAIPLRNINETDEEYMKRFVLIKNIKIEKKEEK